MGNHKSKVSLDKSEIEASEKNTVQDILVDPRSPNVNRTPLARTASHRLDVDDGSQITPKKILHKSVLNYSSKEMKLLDPRSPSQFIPRTPLNMSIDDESLNPSDANQYSLDYSGCIEEASCRNFNERLANITFDDYVGTKEEQQKSMEESCGENINSVISPIVLPTELPKKRPNFMDIVEENISPVVNSTLCNKRNTKLCSTPIQLTNQPKSLLMKKYSKKLKNAQIFIDDENQTTPIKKFSENEKPRTPFGSLLNHLSKSVENLPQQQQQQLKEFGQPIDSVISSEKNKPKTAPKINICMIR